MGKSIGDQVKEAEQHIKDYVAQLNNEETDKLFRLDAELTQWSAQMARWKGIHAVNNMNSRLEVFHIKNITALFEKYRDGAINEEEVESRYKSRWYNRLPSWQRMMYAERRANVTGSQNHAPPPRGQEDWEEVACTEASDDFCGYVDPYHFDPLTVLSAKDEQRVLQECGDDLRNRRSRHVWRYVAIFDMRKLGIEVGAHHHHILGCSPELVGSLNHRVTVYLRNAWSRLCQASADQINAIPTRQYSRRGPCNQADDPARPAQYPPRGPRQPKAKRPTPKKGKRRGCQWSIWYKEFFGRKLHVQFRPCDD